MVTSATTAATLVDEPTVASSVGETTATTSAGGTVTPTGLVEPPDRNGGGSHKRRLWLVENARKLGDDIRRMDDSRAEHAFGESSDLIMDWLGADYASGEDKAIDSGDV